MNNDIFKIRTPWYLGDKFAGFQYWEFEHGRVKLIAEHWESWVSKRDKLTAKPDEQCTGFSDEIGNLIFAGDRIRADIEKGYCFGETGGAMEGDIETITGSIAWNEQGSFVIVTDDDKWIFMDILLSENVEIIGNIHE